jgi:hypothetical protein
LRGRSVFLSCSHAPLRRSADAEESERAHGFSLGDGPMPEAIARSIAEGKREEIERENIRVRFKKGHSWPINFAAERVAVMRRSGDGTAFLLRT